MTTLVLTIIGADRSGLVDSLADVISGHGGNWMESRMAHLGGKFAGILRVSVPAENADALLSAFKELERMGLGVHAEADPTVASGEDFIPVTLELLGNDRPGIVREITHVLAAQGVNVEEFHTECTEAPMSGGQLFRAKAQLRLPPSLDRDALRREIEQVAHDLMVDINLKVPDA
ncbi:MAG: ACT domain-containing protein [Pirellulales bacterium]